MFSHTIGKQRQRKKEAPTNNPAQGDTETTREMLTKKVYQRNKLMINSFGAHVIYPIESVLFSFTVVKFLNFAFLRLVTFPFTKTNFHS